MTSDLLSIAAKRVYYLDQAQNVLAQNIANIDTPGYSPRVARPFASTLDQTARGSLTAPHADDLQPIGASITSTAETITARAPDGNAVSMEQQLASVARTQINQQYAVNIYKSYLGMFTTALGPNP